MKLTIVIVTWNCAHLIERCLRAVFDSVVDFSFEVLIVDNGSADDTTSVVRRSYPQVDVIESGSNLGFAGGNNLAFAKARGELVLLLNPDAILHDPTALARLVKFLDDHPQFAAAGCRLLYPDLTYQVGDAGFRPTTANLLATAVALNHFLPHARTLFLTEAVAVDVRDVDWACGACFLIRQSIIEDVGGLDDGLFMYAEDVEWGCRIRDRGYRIAYIPWIQVVHIQHATQPGEKAAPPTRWLDNLRSLHARYSSSSLWPLVRWSLVLGFMGRGFLYLAASAVTRRDVNLSRSRAMWVFAHHLIQPPVR